LTGRFVSPSIDGMKAGKMVVRFLGGLLLLTACALAFLWFFWLTPLKHIYSETWNRGHSTYDRWVEVQKSIHRIGVTHDAGIEMGYWGGKEWTIWIIEHIKPGQDLSGCDASHLAGALARMTNQQLGDQADIWLAWWKTNQDKTQLEWIRDGFAEKGVVIQQPLTTNNILALLKLANLATNSAVYTNMPSGLRSSLRFNAYRWLRDSDFKARYFDINTIPEEDKGQIIHDLIDYSEWYGIHWNDPGKLQITGNNIGDDRWPDAVFETRPYRWTLYSIMAILALGGCYLLLFKHHNNSH
jgi:hypothetical protein